MDFINKDNILSFLGYAAITTGVVGLGYYLTQELPVYKLTTTAVKPSQRHKTLLSSTRGLPRMLEGGSMGHTTPSCIILLREVVWSSTDIPTYYLVWKGEPNTIYQYSIEATGIEPIHGIFDETNEGVFYKVPVPIFFENSTIYHVKICDASSSILIKASIPVQFIEASRKTAKLTYDQITNTIALECEMNLMPHGFVPGGINISMKIGDDSQFALTSEDYLVEETCDGYFLHVHKQLRPLDITKEDIRLEVLFFSGSNVCSSYTIDRRAAPRATP